ncbi:MAG: redox-regulated ATPase YchF [Nitrospinae bacterium]|nr:redox-regulated ATPase YchF [Nitrospinota bacterium]
MGFSCGIVGLPNVGKSTIFNALTKAGAEASNYPFCTIEPNTGVVPVRDKRLDVISQLVPAEKVVPTTLQFVDIAGLVKGASKGEGLGNKFLGHIREVDAIAHVVRCFEDPNITHVSANVNSLSDIEVINTELMIVDMETLEKRKQKIEKLAKTGNKEAREQMEIMARLGEALDGNRPARSVQFDKEGDAAFSRSLNLLTAKPVLYVCNIADPAESGNIHVQQVTAFAEREGSEVVTLVGKLENEIQEIEDPEDQKAFLKEMGLEETGLDRMVRAGYHLLDLVTFFTVGGKENKAWTVKANAKAPQAAGKIHSDFEKGFIRAEVYNYEDLVKYKSEHAVKEAGLLRVEGKEYVVKDGDIMHFRFNV